MLAFTTSCGFLKVNCNVESEFDQCSFCTLLHEFRPYRYDLNQIPYDYTVEVRNRFKGLDLIEREPDEL